MSYLVKVYCPENGVVLDPFLGSGSTAIGAIKEDRKFVGIELERDYVDISGQRLTERDMDVIISG